MNVNIHGIDNHKIKVALNRLIQAYQPYFQSLEGELDLYATTILSKDQVKAIIRNNYKTYERKNSITSWEDLRSIKYALLHALYQALEELSGQPLMWGVLNGIRPTKLVHAMKREKLSNEAIKQKLMDYYCVQESKADELLKIVNLQIETLGDLDQLKDSISVYIDIPYCMSRCTYCSFTAYLKDHVQVKSDQYLECLFDEIDQLAQFIKAEGLKITTIYIGGGTPTSLNAAELQELLNHTHGLLEGQSVLEFTLEAGRPDSLDEKKLEVIKNSKVTRISINPQTFNEETLHRVNRKHSVESIYEVYEMSRDMGIDNINMDLIVGLPGEGPEDYRDSLKKTIDLNPESITVHSLAIKRKAALRKDYDLMDLSHDFSTVFDEGKRLLEASGYEPYYLYRQKNIVSGLENIGYCKKDYMSLYNVIMIEEAQTIIGLGCGASSKFLDYDLLLNPRDLRTYCETYKDNLVKKFVKLRRGDFRGRSISDDDRED